MIYVLAVYVVLLVIYLCMFLRTKKQEIIAFISDEKYNDICKKLPENKEICKEILSNLANETTKISLNENKKSEMSFYSVFTDEIVLCDNPKINTSFARVIYIAHECQHSIQNSFTLKYNFILAMTNAIYFIALVSLIILNLIPQNICEIGIIIGILVNVFSMLTRIVLETDATYKSVDNARNYLIKHLEAHNAINISNEYSKVISNGYSTFITSVILRNIAILGIQIALMVMYC